MKKSISVISTVVLLYIHALLPAQTLQPQDTIVSGKDTSVITQIDSTLTKRELKAIEKEKKFLVKQKERETRNAPS
ncbi:MAG: hypothetical protein EOM16_08470, partial [Bacteroidia bacterium]|nr:hypothetical protein [Bacteroidia bacterium]